MKNFLKQFGKAICYLILFVGSQTVVSYIFQMGYGFVKAFQMAASGEVPDPDVLSLDILLFTYDNLTTIVFFSGILTVLILWLFFKIRKKSLFTESNITGFSRRYIPILIVLGLSLQIFLSYAISLLPSDIVGAYSEELNTKMGVTGVITILAQVVAAPIVEEIIFRGLILSRLRKAMPTAIAVLLSSAVFGLVHGELLWSSYTFLLGILFAVIAIRTNSVLTTIVLHAIFNAGGAILSALVAETGTNTIAVHLIITGVAAVISCVAIYFLLKKQPELNETKEVA